MGYRPDNEALEEPINKIIDGMNDFSSAVDCRLESGDWQEDHLEKINKVRDKLNKLKIKLIKIKKTTW